MRPEHPNGSVEFYEVIMGDKRSLITGLKCTLWNCDDTRGKDFHVIAVNAYPSKDMLFETDFPDDYLKLCEEDDTHLMKEMFLKEGFAFYKSDPLINQLQCSSFSNTLLFGILFSCIFVPAFVFLSIYKIRKMQDIKVVLPPGLGFNSTSPVKNNSATISLEDDHDIDSEQTMETTDNECSTLTGKEYNFRAQDFEKVISDKPQPQFYLTSNNDPVIENFTTNKEVSGYIKIQPDSGYIKIQPNAGGYVTFPLSEPTKVSFFKYFFTNTFGKKKQDCYCIVQYESLIFVIVSFSYN